MSQEAIHRNARRWLAQAEDDLEAARTLLAGRRFAQACFWCQQASEKALKAVWISHDLEPWGHSVARLVRDLPAALRAPFGAMEEDALYLDKLYIPTRYPDAIADLTPGEAYTRREAETALSHAESFLARAGALVP